MIIDIKQETKMQYSKDGGDFHEPLVGTECEFNHPSEGWVRVFVVGCNDEGSVVVQHGSKYLTLGYNPETRPIDKTKTIDMTLFKDSGVLLESDHEIIIANEYSCRQLDLDHFYPVKDHWNHFEGTEKPPYLKGFEFEVKCVLPAYDYRHEEAYTNEVKIDSTESIDWEHVIAIKFKGLKEGYEYTN